MIATMVIALAIGCTASEHPDDQTSDVPAAAESFPYDVGVVEPETFELPGELSEISGLAVGDDGRLFAHDDEESQIYQLDTGTGRVIKSFNVGDMPGASISSDFEDIEIVGDRFFLIESNGDLYEFREGDDGITVDYTKTETGLKRSNDIEGICYDPATNALLLACKAEPGDGLDGVRAIYSWSLETNTLGQTPRFTINTDTARSLLGIEKFRPSGIERHPDGSFLVLSGRDPGIIQLSADGAIIAWAALPEDVHVQPEGITIAKDGTLYISNEGTLVTPKMMKYRLE